MEKIIFSKYSSERSRSFAIRTDILQDETGKRVVEKHPLYPEGMAHVSAILRWHELLQKEYAGSGLAVNHCETASDGVRLEYLVGETLQERILTLAKEKREEEILAYVAQYLDRMTKGSLKPFQKTEQFTEVFGEVELPPEATCLAVTNIDMIFSNILLTGEEWSFIDYEWTFDFPVPIHFVLYRAFFLAANEIPDAACIAFEPMMDRLGIGKEEYQEYAKMEAHFQQYIRGNETPVRDLMTQIGYRVIPMKEIDEQVRRREQPKFGIAFTESGKEEAGDFQELSPDTTAGSLITLHIPVLPEADSLTLELGNGSTLLFVKQLVTDDVIQPVDGLAVNGMELGAGMYLVMAETLQLKLPCKGCKQIKLSFLLQKLTLEINEVLVGNINRLFEQRNDLTKEVIRLQGENEDFKNSKAYKIYKLTRSNR